MEKYLFPQKKNMKTYCFAVCSMGLKGLALCCWGVGTGQAGVAGVGAG